MIMSAGAYVDLFGRKFHEGCFCCDGCEEKLTTSFVKRPAEKKALCRYVSFVVPCTRRATP
jgi:hypothetical protein